MLQPRLFPTPQLGTTSDDHHTPKWVFDALGVQFDLDVACPPEGPLHTPCKAYYTQEDDGLASDWHGTIWMNPPFSKSTPWVHRFIEHGNGIALLPVVKGYWVKTLWEHPEIKCTMGMAPDLDRMTFHHKDKMKEIMFHVMFWAIGDEPIKALHNLGRVR